MQFSIGDKVLFKRENLKGRVVKINSHYKLTVLSKDGFEINVSVKDLVKIEEGTDKADSYGEVLYPKDISSGVIKSRIKKHRSQNVLKVDLHIELLTSNYHHMDNFEIMQIQLNECSRNIEIALNSKITKIEIVHGIGEGTLRHEVHKILRNYNLRFYVTTDGGATEVFL